jgi:hypothetical protein
MAPRNTKGKEFMLQQLYEAENVPESEKGSDEFTGLTINQILKRIDKSKNAPAAAPVEDDEGQYRPWSAYRG